MVGDLSIEARVSWLRQWTILADLPEAALRAIAGIAQERLLAEHQRLGLEDQTVDAAYVLYAGNIESYRTSATAMAQVSNLLPGAVIYLQEVLLEQPVQQTTVALGDVILWELHQSDVQPIVQQFPIGPSLLNLLTQPHRIAARADNASLHLIHKVRPQCYLALPFLF